MGVSFWVGKLDKLHLKLFGLPRNPLIDLEREQNYSFDTESVAAGFTKKRKQKKKKQFLKTLWIIKPVVKKLFMFKGCTKFYFQLLKSYSKKH